MTVSLTDKQYFKATIEDVARCVRKVLYGDSLYRGVVESPDGLQFSFIYQPRMPFLLPTDMTIELYGMPSETAVIIGTVSQPFVVGDIFGSYDHYIADLFKKLNKVASRQEAKL